MSRPLRIEYPGAIYHITSRGNAKMPIFEDDEDRECFIDILEDVVKRFNWVVHAYCIMDNHYHLLVETVDGILSKGMRHLNGLYTQRFNRSHDRVGHIFQGRFKSVLVNRESHLLELCRYVVLNPVRAGMVKEIDQYRWSSYRATAGLEGKPECLTVDWILSQFDMKKTEAENSYKKFVHAGLGISSPWEDLKGQSILGDKEFEEKLKPALKDKSTLKEITRVDRFALRPSLEDVFINTQEKGKRVRNGLIRKAHLDYGYTLSEIGRYLGLHYTTVSNIIKKLS
jgi:REP element-mobilizing transposase RayT